MTETLSPHPSLYIKNQGLWSEQNHEETNPLKNQNKYSPVEVAVI